MAEFLIAVYHRQQFLGNVAGCRCGPVTPLGPAPPDTAIDGSRSGSTSEKERPTWTWKTPRQEMTKRCFHLLLRSDAIVELRRYVCLDMARAGGAAPDNMVRVAHDMERFLIGHGPRIANDQD
jgi:hypothetical protein